MKKILIINGPNLNLLGTREPSIYGGSSFESYFNRAKESFANDLSLNTKQSNHEGDIVDFIQQAMRDGIDGIVLNAGAYTHTSIAIRDAISACDIPVVEVHISNIFKREEFRHKSFLSDVCVGIISGFGLESYTMALNYFNTKN